MSQPSHHFLRFSLRQLLFLFVPVALLLAILVTRFQTEWDHRRQRVATEALLESAARDDLDGVQQALQSGGWMGLPDIRSGGNRYTALHYAVKHGNIEMIQLLLDSGANLDAVSQQGTPLCVAIQNEDHPIIRYLLDAGADVNLGPPLPLGLCIKRGDTKTMKILLKEGAIASSIPDYPRNFMLQTPAASRLEVMKLLLEHGAKVQDACLHAAIAETNLEMYRLAIKHGASTDPLRDAIVFNRVEELKHLLEKNPRLMTRVCYEIEPGLVTDDFRAYERRRRLPLQMALARGQNAASLFLIEAGAPLDVLLEEGDTLLHAAAIGGDAELVRALIDRGLDVNARNHHQFTPLHRAASKNSAEAAKVLLKAGANANAQNEFGETPLMAAAHYKSINVAKVLLSAGADRTLRNHQQLTAADLARQYDDDAMVGLLR